jgi:L-cystine uptake protein TcyP (sodium:dicarboxylate symporter family)
LLFAKCMLFNNVHILLIRMNNRSPKGHFKYALWAYSYAFMGVKPKGVI